jgi:hypothetical protein
MRYPLAPLTYESVGPWILKLASVQGPCPAGGESSSTTARHGDARMTAATRPPHRRLETRRPWTDVPRDPPFG